MSSNLNLQEIWLSFEKETNMAGEDKTNRAHAYSIFNVSTFVLCGAILIGGLILQKDAFGFYSWAIAWPFLAIGVVCAYCSMIYQSDIIG